MNVCLKPRDFARRIAYIFLGNGVSADALSRPAKSGTLVKISATPALALLAPGRVPGYFHLPLAGLIEKISAFMRGTHKKLNKEHKS